MSKHGYLISKNKAITAFFTSASSYDRPQWISINEGAKVYPTAEIAEAAARKLYVHGAYEARVVSLAEAIELSMPDDTVSDDPNAAELEPEDDKQDMVAISKGAKEEPIHQGDESQGVEGAVDVKLGISDKADRKAIDVTLDAEDKAEKGDDLLDDEDGEQVAGGPDGAPIVGESETMPAKPMLDAKPSENNNTAIDLPKTPVIKYKEPAYDQDDKEDTDMSKSGAWPNGAKVKTPANVTKDLKAVIAAFQKTADIADKNDDAKASFAMTVVGAFQELMQDLEQETAEGIKAAQIHMTSWMNPITALLPVSVQQFVVMGGRKPSLKQFFDAKRSEQ